MTTIAMKDGIIAADSLVTAGDLIRGYTNKLRTLRDGRIFAYTGMLGIDREVIDWLDAGGPPNARPTLPEESGFSAIVAWKEGFIVYSRDLRPQVLEAPFYAIGSGNEIALGAMMAGMSAAAAVRIACEADVYSGGEISEIVLPAALSLPGFLDRAVGRSHPGSIEAGVDHDPPRPRRDWNMGADR